MVEKDTKDSKSQSSTGKKTSIEKKTKSKNRGWKVAGVALLIIIVVIGILYLLYGAIAGSLVSLILSNNQLSGQVLKNVLLQRVKSMPTLATTFAGNISLNGQDPNIKVSYFKYYNDTRLTYFFNNISFIGNGDITVINSTNNSANDEICVPTSLALFSSSQLSTKTIYYCANSTSTNYLILVNQLNGVVNLNNITNLHTSFDGLGFYNWQPCYKVSGTGDTEFDRQLIKEQGMANSELSFNTCISAQYGIPIKLSGTIEFQDASGVSNDTLGFNLTQSNLNKSATYADVFQLPIGT